MRRRVFAMNGLGPALIGTSCVLTTLAGTAGAQQAPAPGSPGPLEEVVVTGIRKSLYDATEAKRESTGFTDSVFAEDIGKFPDTNIAESFNRIPGITISREISGEGLSIAIRGLGTNFTKILLNDAPVAVASTGRTDAQNTNREVDLDLFPTELFTQLTVRKSSSASMLEGGAAGTVNMRSARPFDGSGGTPICRCLRLAQLRSRRRKPNVRRPAAAMAPAAATGLFPARFPRMRATGWSRAT
jgi:outer membrane receptor protein involved in Fe transport